MGMTGNAQMEHVGLKQIFLGHAKMGNLYQMVVVVVLLFYLLVYQHFLVVNFLSPM
jgi:hypothetical protein